MATEDRNTQIVKSFKCTAAMATKYVSVMIDTSAANTVKVPTAATDVPIGVISCVGTTAGDLVDVVMFGIAKVKAGGTITRGDHVQIKDTTGEVKVLVATGYDIGVALETAADHDIIEVFVNINGLPKA